MKQLFLFSLIVTSIMAVCQAPHVKTRNVKVAIITETEYNYMSKGYKTQVEQGLDMKKGYLAENSIQIAEGSYLFEFIPLDRIEGKDTLFVGFILKAKSGYSGTFYWYAIPAFDYGDYTKKAFDEIGNLDCNMRFLLARAYNDAIRQYLYMVYGAK